jgi:hypothetical protein
MELEAGPRPIEKLEELEEELEELEEGTEASPPAFRRAARSSFSTSTRSSTWFASFRSTMSFHSTAGLSDADFFSRTGSFRSVTSLRTSFHSTTEASEVATPTARVVPVPRDGGPGTASKPSQAKGSKTKRNLVLLLLLALLLAGPFALALGLLL